MKLTTYKKHMMALSYGLGWRGIIILLGGRLVGFLWQGPNRYDEGESSMGGAAFRQLFTLVGNMKTPRHHVSSVIVLSITPKACQEVLGIVTCRSKFESYLLVGEVLQFACLSNSDLFQSPGIIICHSTTRIIRLLSLV